MPTQIEKLQAHAAHLLDAFIQLRERYALLEPMLFDEAVTKERGSGQQARGFRILKHSLFLSCSQDIAKLSLDDDQRTPSLSNLVRSLSDEAICAELKKTFTAWEVPLAEEAKEPEIVEALRRMALREEAERQEQFDSLHGEAMELWSYGASFPQVMLLKASRQSETKSRRIRRSTSLRTNTSLWTS